MADVIERMTWTVVSRESATASQQEDVKYTEEAAKALARRIMKDGGIAMIVEGSEPVDVSRFRSNRNAMDWD